MLRCQFPSHVSIMSVQSQSKLTPTGASLVFQRLRTRLACRDVGLIPAQGIKIPYAVKRLSPRASTREKPKRHHCLGQSDEQSVCRSAGVEVVWGRAGCQRNDCDCFSNKVRETEGRRQRDGRQAENKQVFLKD